MLSGHLNRGMLEMFYSQEYIVLGVNRKYGRITEEGLPISRSRANIEYKAVPRSRVENSCHFLDRFPTGPFAISELQISPIEKLYFVQRLSNCEKVGQVVYC